MLTTVLEFVEGSFEMESATAYLYQDIRKVAAYFDVSLRTPRYYEQAGLLNPLRKGNTRLYSREDIIRIELILRAKRLGFSINEIYELIKLNNKKERINIFDCLSTDKLKSQLEILKIRRQDINVAIDEIQYALQAVVNIVGANAPAPAASSSVVSHPGESKEH